MDTPEIARKQKLRNDIAKVEDAARSRRNQSRSMEHREMFDMIARLAQLVREEIVR